VVKSLGCDGSKQKVPGSNPSAAESVVQWWNYFQIPVESSTWKSVQCAITGPCLRMRHRHSA